MKLRFQADADLNEDIVTGLLRRAPEMDFQMAQAAGLRGLDDPVVLARTAQFGRVLVSHDGKTMPGHFGEFIAVAESPGLLIVPQSLDTQAAIEELLMVWVASEAEEWTNRIARLPL
jgi:hypothetical protein